MVNSKALSTVGFVTLAIAGMLSNSASAQYYGPTDIDTYQRNEIDSTSSTLGQGIDAMELIHRARFSNSRSPAEFSEDSYNEIKDAAAEFKRLQQQQLEADTPGANQP